MAKLVIDDSQDAFALEITLMDKSVVEMQVTYPTQTEFENTLDEMKTFSSEKTGKAKDDEESVHTVNCLAKYVDEASQDDFKNLHTKMSSSKYKKLINGIIVAFNDGAPE